MEKMETYANFVRIKAGIAEINGNFCFTFFEYCVMFYLLLATTIFGGI